MDSYLYFYFLFRICLMYLFYLLSLSLSLFLFFNGKIQTVLICCSLKMALNLVVVTTQCLGHYHRRKWKWLKSVCVSAPNVLHKNAMNLAWIYGEMIRCISQIHGNFWWTNAIIWCGVMSSKLRPLHGCIISMYWLDTSQNSYVKVIWSHWNWRVNVTNGFLYRR